MVQLYHHFLSLKARLLTIYGLEKTFRRHGCLQQALKAGLITRLDCNGSSTLNIIQE
jgi:hypothetical protein